MRHNWDTWTNTAPVAGDQQKEAAHVFTQAKDTSVQVYTGAIAAGSPNLTIAAGTIQFVAGDAGLEIVVEGAGASGADLVTTILTFVSATAVTLAANAVTAIASGGRVRWRLQTLAKTATKTGTASVNSALKSSDHSNFSGNIKDPAWNKSFGYAELGSTNTINFPLGFWNQTAGSWVYHNQIEASKTYYAIFRMARKNARIKPRGFIGAHIWDGSSGKKQVVEGGRFNLSVRVEGVPAATVSSRYKVIARTDRGETLESNIFTINRPTNASFITNVVYVVLTWAFLPGVRIYEVWRDTGGVYEKLTEITNSQTIFLDQNAVAGTGSGFPAGDIQRRKAEAFSRPGDLDNINVDGNGDWDFMRISLFVPPSYDTSSTNQQWLRVFLTDACDREVTDGVTNGTITVDSATAVFTADDMGLGIRIVSGSNIFNGTIASVVDADTITVNAAVPFSAATATITIIGGGRGGLLIGEFGLSLTPGTWAANHDDSNAARSAAVNPTGSTVGGNNPTENPNSGTQCVRSDMRVRMHTDDRKIEELAIRYTQVGNLTASGNLKPNCVLKKISGVVDCLIEIRAGGRTLFCTETEPLFKDFSNFDLPTPAGMFKKGDTIAMNPEGRDELHVITHFEHHYGRFDVESYEELYPGHVSIIEGFYRHNRKQDIPILQL